MLFTEMALQATDEGVARAPAGRRTGKALVVRELLDGSGDVAAGPANQHNLTAPERALAPATCPRPAGDANHLNIMRACGTVT